MNSGASTWQGSKRERSRKVKEWDTNLARKALMRMTKSRGILRPMV